MSSDQRTGTPDFSQADTRPPPHSAPTGGGPLPETVSQPVPVHPPLPPPPLPALPGYELLGVIARGGMGVVYKARQLSLNRLVAVKMILGGGHHDPTAVARFLIEAEAIARIRHPHVVPVYEFALHDGLPYLAMELVDGGTLAQKVIREGKLDPRRAAAILERVAAAVAAAHAQGVIHRDLKPGNILLTAAGEPKVTDFGMAKVGDTQLTASGAMIGTPSYMSPEQARGRVREVGTAADIWALGCVLYTLLTARLPFEADSHPATLQLVLTAEPDRPRAVDPHVPRDLETICLKCLEKEPDRRYATAAALADDLRAFLAGRPIAARPVSSAERVWKWAKRHPGRAAAWAGVAAAALMAVGAAVAVNRWYHHHQRETTADHLVSGLLRSDPATVSVYVKEIERDGVRDLAVPKLRAAAAEDPVGTRRGLHARIALLPDEPDHRRELIEYVPYCRLDELPLFTPLAAQCAGETDRLWAVVESRASTPAAVLRAAAVLAGWAPDDSRWAAHADAVGDRLARANPIEAEVYAAAFRPARPVRTTLLPVLLDRYQDARRRLDSGKLTGEELIVAFNEFHVSAQLLAHFTAADHPAELTELAVTVSGTHYRLFADAVLAHKEDLLPRLRVELAGNRPVPDWEAVAAGAVPIESAAVAVFGVAAERTFTRPEGPLDAAAKRRGHAAALLARFGEVDAVWPLFADAADPTARSYLLARLPVVGVPADVLAERYVAEPDVGAKHALLHALGDYRPTDLPADRFGPLAAALLAEYERHPDPGLHSSIGWLLRQQWGKGPEVAAADARLTAAAAPAATALFGHAAVVGRGWLVNGQGQTYTVVRGPITVRLGSPVTEPDRMPIREPGRREVIVHSFAIAAREVTAGEFARFLASSRKTPPDGDPEWPAGRITWYQAAEYCNWLSKQEGIPEDEWCYERNKDGEYGPGMRIRENRLNLRGYRLPTEAEWVCGCRAGCDLARYYGRGTDLLRRYAWFGAAPEDLRPVGRLRPNAWGLFDTLGNVWEWCEDAAWLDTPEKPVESYWVVKDADLHKRVYHGGSYVDGGGSLRPANRNSLRPVDTSYNIGLRPVRTLP